MPHSQIIGRIGSDGLQPLNQSRLPAFRQQPRPAPRAINGKDPWSGQGFGVYLLVRFRFGSVVDSGRVVGYCFLSGVGGSYAYLPSRVPFPKKFNFVVRLSVC